jgi:DNA-binding protein HU-beta
MNKSDLAKKVADATEVSQVVAMKAVNAVFEGVTEALMAGQKVTIVGFGTFKTSERKARNGRNPQTGESMTIEAKTLATFKAGKELAEAVNK